jgi:translation initiation factor IF-2
MATRGRGGGGGRRPARAPRVPPSEQPAPPPPAPTNGAVAKAVQIPHILTVKELGDLLRVSPVEVIKELMKNGVMASINQTIDFDTAAVVAHDMGYEPQEATATEIEELAAVEAPVEVEAAEPEEQEDPASLKPRPPVVAVLGHVDHGKTSLLDAIRLSNVTAREAGGITQHIGAYQVETNGHPITFIDTPGHAAFTAMRARGAQATDIAVLAVAADDGIMPQTKEAIDHARAAGVPIVVAITKVDLEGANVDRVKAQLAEQGLTIEEYGGDVIAVPVSAKTGEGLPELLENILVAAEVLELKANPDRPAAGIVIEAELDRTRGPKATVLVEKGTLRVGDVAVVNETWGRVKAMFDEDGKRLKEAAPGEPAVILGLQDVPKAGDILRVVADDKVAREIVLQRLREKEAAARRVQPRVSLDTLFGDITEGKVKDLNLVLKTDVQGSIEPIRQSLESLSTDQTRVNVIHTASGSVTESDVMLAIASKAIIIAFNTKPEPGASKLIEQEGVDLRQYSVIYEMTEDVEKALLGMREPTFKEVVTAHAEVRQVFQVGRKGAVAGCYVRDGTVSRSDQVRVMRGEEQVIDSRIASLRRFKDDAREVQTGFECGISIENFAEFQEGDVLEFYRRERDN